MRKLVRVYKPQNVVETVFNDKVMELVIPTGIGSPEKFIKSYFVLVKNRWVCVLRTTDREVPEATGPFLKGLLDGAV